jgi:DNA (cytosine-5)-methyltransferase 1
LITERTLTVGSLFAGIGGFDLGLERAGFKIKWQVEIDQWCRDILTKHWPTIPKYADIRECGKNNLSPVDLICGGDPCQPHSLTGNRKGKEDDRYLWPEMFRIISLFKPTWIINENVIGSVSNMVLDEKVADLEGIGYTCQPFDIPSCAVNADHERRRIWLIAHAQGNAIENPILQEEQGGTSFEGEHRGILLNPSPGNHWETCQPPLIDMEDGLSEWAPIAKATGNAVVPQIPEIIGRMIMEIERAK